MLEQLHPSQDPPPPQIPQKLTPQRRYWKAFEPAYMKEDVPDPERLSNKQKDVMGYIYELMDKIAEAAIAAEEDFGADEDSLNAFIAWGIAEKIVLPDDGKELTGWFLPTHH